MYRKLSAKAIDQYMRKEMNNTFFKDFQYAFKKSGMEKIVHTINYFHSCHPDWDFASLDARNAFNESNKYIGLSTILDKFPKAFNFMKSIYLQDSNQFYFNERADSIKIIPSKTGFHQGDVLGSWAFAVTIQPLLVGLSDHLKEKFGEVGASFHISFFVDDGYVCAPHNIVVEALKYLKNEGPKYGYHINKNKGAILLGKCGSVEETESRFSAYCDVKLKDNNEIDTEATLEFRNEVVKIHPSDVHLGIANEVATNNHSPGTMNNIISNYANPELKYGMKVLGTYIGNDAFVKSELAKVLKEWDVIKEKLIRFPIIQQRMLLFRYCFSSKPVHILRTTPEHLTLSFAGEFMKMQQEVMESMFDRKLSNEVMNFACLPIDEGGLGILHCQDIQSIAHIASFFGVDFLANGFFEYLEEHGSDDISTDLGSLAKRMIDKVASMKDILSLREDVLVQNVIKTLTNLKVKALHDNGTFQSELYFLQIQQKIAALDELSVEDIDNTFKHLVNFRTMKDKSAGMWLRTHCGRAEFCLSNREFSTALCLRYFQEIPYIGRGGQCPFCKEGKHVDSYGHHFISGCKSDLKHKGVGQKTQPHAIHDHVNYTLYRITKNALVYSVREPYHLFNASNKRPDIYVKFGDNANIIKPYAIDLTIVSPYVGTESGQLAVPGKPIASAAAHLHDRFRETILQVNNKIHEKRANEAKQDKVREYGDLCKNIGVEFVPFVMTSTGKLHSEGISFLKKLATHASEVRNIPFGTLFRYYKKLLSISLIKQVTHTIHTKSIARLSRNTSNNFEDDIRDTNILIGEEGDPHLFFHNNFRET